MDVRSLEGIGPLRAETLGDSRVCVAVLDGPVDPSHPCFNGADLRRLNTLVQDPPGGGAMSTHGTHVASLIFGQPDSLAPGIAPMCRGLLAPVFRDGQDVQRVRLSQLDLARAVEQAVQEGAHIINISGGERSPNGQADPMLERALRLCNENNVLVIAATGNDACACLHIPAAHPSVLAVGALGNNGEPLEISNWGEAYQSNGILAPGEDIDGAVPSGGTAHLTGSSFATPIVSGVAALLLSLQRRNGQPVDPKAIGRAILETALPCHPQDDPECQRYLVGTLNIPGAHAFITKGGRTIVVTPDVAQIPSQVADASAAHSDVDASAASDTGVEAAGIVPSAELASAKSADDLSVDGSTAQTAALLQPAGPPPMPTLDMSVAPSGQQSTSVPTGSAGVTGMVPSAGCKCKDVKASDNARVTSGVVPSADCNCNGATTSNVFAVGTLGFDFGTEARRDTFRQLMPYVERPGEGRGAPTRRDAPNPYDVKQLMDYIEGLRPDGDPIPPEEGGPVLSDSTKLIWTLNLDLIPIYAIETESAYAESIYRILRAALRSQILPRDDENHVSRVSVPGVMTNRTRRLFSGQVVPVVEVQERGLSMWNENALITAAQAAVLGSRGSTDELSDRSRQLLQAFLDKLYNQLRNLGQSSPDRALNFTATNAFVAADFLSSGLLSGERSVPRVRKAEEAQERLESLYTFDEITVSKSPYCRPDSDCWDVRVTFFDPTNDRAATVAFELTVDVSDQLPVTLGPYRQYLIANR